MRHRKLTGYNWTVFIILAVGSIVMAFPFIWMILSSFKTTADVYAYPPRWIPSSWDWHNYSEVFRMIPFFRYYFNSIYTSVAQTLLEITLSVTAAFALSKLRFPGRNFLINLIRSTMFVPMIVTLIPLYLLVSRAGWIDTYRGIILPQIFSAFTIFLLMSFFVTVPNDLLDSAKLDGCGYYRILTKVIIPNSMTAIGTAVMFSFLGHWKSYTWPLIITNKTNYRTLPIGLKYLVQESSSEYQVMMAASVMAILPVLIVFMFSEKQLVRSVTLTGLKS
ncbi:MAG: carbohydrate ABC transporter permease [Sphaerochaetaceae bacterium]|nr:carbohydrate ABC transporter permease [Sphaerochaetaceae bacterium]MDD2405938.1 carbohydrate ABC transporter permease [Sphaerochaetaceae bacterium]MDD3670342.1 carbohydrate ABC transporter permease [Sphaerochaetaceae bacterium]MDD4260322.1 carbohydrate ABC transporter permease [Sphaerochaetaceae bacterium]MDD4763352.1 carbohydrate ABC transporter permease [Sphaerochaetaceae bacterium]